MANKYYLMPNPGLVLERRTRHQLDCPYCHKGKPIVDDNVSYVAVEHSAGLLWFNYLIAKKRDFDGNESMTWEDLLSATLTTLFTWLVMFALNFFI